MRMGEEIEEERWESEKNMLFLFRTVFFYWHLVMQLSQAFCNICKWQTCVSFYFLGMEQNKITRRWKKRRIGLFPFVMKMFSNTNTHPHLCIDRTVKELEQNQNVKKIPMMMKHGKMKTLKIAKKSEQQCNIITHDKSKKEAVKKLSWLSLLV